MLGRLVHYSVDAVLLSTVLAGVRRSSGFTCVLPPFSVLGDDTKDVLLIRVRMRVDRKQKQ